MSKMLLAFICVFFVSMATASANGLHDVQDKIGTDKFAHAGVGYIVADQLQRNAHFSALESFATVFALAYVKEKFIDDTFSKADIGATLMGPALYQIKF